MTSSEPLQARYKPLGNSGFRVSVPIVGCMGLGSSKWLPWVLDPEEAAPILKAAYDLGATTWDTANVYSNGESERAIAYALKKYDIPRSEIQILTKCFSYTAKPGTKLTGFLNSTDHTRYSNHMGLSRAAIFEQVNASLERLETDYIDLLQIHRFDYATPIEETMRALHDLVQAGKVHYIGASSMFAYQFSMMQSCAQVNGWTKFISMQDQYSLAYREEEREMIPYCNVTNVGIIPYGPLAGGVLTRPLEEASATVRGELTAKVKASGGPSVYNTEGEANDEIVRRVQKVAEKLDWPMADVALAWVQSKVTSPIVGVTSIKRIEAAVAAAHKSLDPEDIAYLEEPYVPRNISGFR